MGGSRVAKSVRTYYVTAPYLISTSFEKDQQIFENWYFPNDTFNDWGPFNMVKPAN